VVRGRRGPGAHRVGGGYATLTSLARAAAPASAPQGATPRSAVRPRRNPSALLRDRHPGHSLKCLAPALGHTLTPVPGPVPRPQLLGRRQGVTVVDSDGAFTVHQEPGTDSVRIFPSGELDMLTAPILDVALQAVESAAPPRSWSTSGVSCSWTAVASASCLGHTSGQEGRLGPQRGPSQTSGAPGPGANWHRGDPVRR
jgi:hypothetical protein